MAVTFTHWVLKSRVFASPTTGTRLASSNFTRIRFHLSYCMCLNINKIFELCVLVPVNLFISYVAFHRDLGLFLFCFTLSILFA
jgi:hypothetical protein